MSNKPWTCPRCFGDSAYFRVTCEWCQYNPKKGHLTEEDVQKLVQPWGEVLWTYTINKNGQGMVIHRTPLRFAADYPPHENWKLGESS